MQTGDPAGTLKVLRDEEVPVYFGLRITPHQLGLSDVLATLALGDEQPGSVTVLGLVPQSLELTLELSELIRSRLSDLVAATIGELTRLDYPPAPKSA